MHSCHFSVEFGGVRYPRHHGLHRALCSAGARELWHSFAILTISGNIDFGVTAKCIFLFEHCTVNADSPISSLHYHSVTHRMKHVHVHIIQRRKCSDQLNASKAR